jgi:hypothetical protein
MLHLKYATSSIKLRFLLIVFLACLVSCKSDDVICTKDITSSTTTIEKSSICINAFEELSFYSKEKPYLIITSKEQYDTVIIEQCNTNIDFANYNLIIGYFRSDRKVIAFNNKFYRYCADNSYGLEVTVTRGKPENVTFYIYNILVPKKELINDLVVNFMLQN